MGKHQSLDYRKKSIPYSWNQRLVWPQRQKFFEFYARVFPPRKGEKILDFGVNGSMESAEEYFFETNYPYKDQITGVGLEPGDRFL